MRHALSALARNLAAGVRAALFLPVRKAAFRIDATQLVLLTLVGCAIDAAGDRWRAGADALFDGRAFGTELGGVALVALAAIVIGSWLKRAGAAMTLVTVLMAAYPLMAVVRYGIFALATQVPTLEAHFGAVYWAMVAWSLLVALRVVAIELDEPLRRRVGAVVLGGAVLMVPIVGSAWVLAEFPWFRDAASHDAADGASPSPASEAVLAAQADLLDDALGGLEDHESGAPNLYFVGYAPDATEPAWTAHLQRVQKAVDDRLGTRGRSLLLRNDRATLLDLPFATVTHLRDTLGEVAGAADPDQDIVIVYIGARGSRNGDIEGTLPPLDLVTLTPGGLKSLLDEAGITWRVIVVAACGSGAFVDMLADDHTAVIASSTARGPASACEGRGEPTLFGDALFGEGFARGDSLEDAFVIARDSVAKRERERGLAPSQPVLSVGEAIAPRVRHLRRAGRGVTTAAHAPAASYVSLRIQ